MYDRVSTFLETLHRHFARDDYPANALVVTHGLTMRLFCMRWFHWPVEYFESLRNPDNGDLRTLILGGDGRYSLDTPFDQWRPTPLPSQAPPLARARRRRPAPPRRPQPPRSSLHGADAR